MLDRLTPAQQHAVIAAIAYVWAGVVAGAAYVIDHAADLSLPGWVVPVLGLLATSGTLAGTSATHQYGVGSKQEDAPEGGDLG